MLIQNISYQNSFTGTFSDKTLKMVYDELGTEGLKIAKKFRAGKGKFDKIDVTYETTSLTNTGQGHIMQTDTFINVTNLKSKKPPTRMLLKEGKLPFGDEMFELIKQKMASLDKIKGFTTTEIMRWI